MKLQICNLDSFVLLVGTVFPTRIWHFSDSVGVLITIGLWWHQNTAFWWPWSGMILAACATYGRVLYYSLNADQVFEW